jgi:hypothetical protein
MRKAQIKITQPSPTLTVELAAQFADDLRRFQPDTVFEADPAQRLRVGPAQGHH